MENAKLSASWRIENFRQKVLDVVEKIPSGKVMSYGQVAALAGSPKAARQVGQILKFLDIEKAHIPWWRVLNSKGQISIKGNWTADKNLQKSLLIKEGIEISEDFSVDMVKYQYILENRK